MTSLRFRILLVGVPLVLAGFGVFACLFGLKGLIAYTLLLAGLFFILQRAPVAFIDALQSRNASTHTGLDRADALATAGRPAEAVRLLREKLAAEPGDRVLRERLASLLLEKTSDRDAALAEFLALGKEGSRRDRARALHRAADILEGSDRRAEADALLLAFAAECPGTREEELIRERRRRAADRRAGMPENAS